MPLAGESITLPFSRCLEDWGNAFAHLPGFVYLDSGCNTPDAERELVTALPTRCYQLRDYSGSATDWMTAIEKDLAAAQLPASDGRFNGAAVVGCLEYDATADALRGDTTNQRQSVARLYHWGLMTELETRQTTLQFHPDCPALTREHIKAIVENNNREPQASTAFGLSRPFEPCISRDQYRSAIGRIHEYILAGDCYQVNFAQRFEAAAYGDPWHAYRVARQRLAGGFSGFLRAAQDEAILSLSPERFLQVKDGVVISQPIKGTAPRHEDPEADRAAAATLMASVKDRAENVMITDLLRNDIGQFCVPGSVRVTELCGLYSFSNVHHLISTVEGRLADNISAGQVMVATSPGGSITGAPKKRAVEIIKELESHPRRAYCGSLFIMLGNNSLQSSIAIRTLEMRGERLYCWGGGGITASSDWAAEYQETLDKVGPIMRLLEQTS